MDCFYYFLVASDPMVIIRKLTKEIIEEAIQAYAEGDAYSLKFYGAQLNSKTLNLLKEHAEARTKFLLDLLNKN